jgi:M6 family metalloprotease-like protein
MKSPRRSVRAFALLGALAGLVLWWRTSSSPARALPDPGAAAAGPHTPAAVAARAAPPPRSPAALSPVLAAPDSALGRFQFWTQRYLAAAPADRAALVPEGVQLATARRPVFKALIVAHPREALRQAVPMVARPQLPAEVVAQLEERIGGRAQLRIYQSTPLDPAALVQPPVARYAEFPDGSTYEAHVYGRRTESMRWLPNASLNGVALDRALAVHESPLRRLEVGELPAAGKPAVEICPVSGKTTLATPPTAAIEEAVVAVEAHGEIVYLCDGSHVTLFEDQVAQLELQGEGVTGGTQRFTGALPASPSTSLGELRVLYLPLTFADQNTIPVSEAKCYEVMRDVSEFFYKASYGRLTAHATVTPPIKLPHNEAWYVQKDSTEGFSKEFDALGLEHSHAREEARKLGYDSGDFDAVVVRLTGGPRSAGVGGWGGGTSVWMYNDSPGTVAHELGHCFGLAHANYWDTGGASAIGPGSNLEYGDIFDVMGSSGANFPRNHLNAQAKNQVRWLANDFVQTVTTSGTYRLHAFDQAQLDPAHRYALKLTKDTQRTYWAELRALIDAENKWVAHGLILGWRWPLNSGQNLQLIDTTPSSPAGRADAPLVVGQTFSDPDADIHLTTLAVATDAAGERSADVRVNVGPFPGNRAPSLALTATALNVPTTAPVTFAATATDPDGDALAYHWRASDNTAAATAVVGPNAPAFTRSFATAGQYVVTCTVSDMKGGTATRHLLVIVGNGNARFAISGRITLAGQGLAGVGVSTGTGNGGLTDSDGYYTVPNLTAGTYTVSPLLFGYTFNELFNNSVFVGPAFSGAHFSADLVPTVSLVATPPRAAEAGVVTGTFTLTRTGSDVEPLIVALVPPTGTATLTTDYTFSPALTAGTPYNTVTIPAGAATLDLVVTPVNDTVSEGPETITLQLGLDSAYAVAGSPTATVTLDDDDTALPKVSLTADTLAALENPTRTARFTVARTGLTTAALTVSLTYAGTATSGPDYTALPATVTIPAGAATAALTLTPLNDTVAEDFETVVATVATDAAYVIDSAAPRATLTIVDDDQQVVSLAIADAVATEVNLSAPGAVPDPAIFVVTRSGDLSAPLTVYYALAGTALHGVDYEALPGSVTLPAGEARASLVITPRFDSLGEPANESVLVQLAAGGGGAYRLGPVSSGIVTIADAGDAPYVEVIPLTSAREPSTAGKFRFTLRGNATAALTVNYTVSGTATAGTDYTALSGSVTFTNGGGNNAVDVTVSPANDALAEDLETIVVTLTPSATYQTWEPTRSATLWLYDDEQPTVFVDAHGTASNGVATLAESATTAGKFYLSRTGSTTAALTVNYTLSGTATPGADYQTLSGSLAIPAGAPGVDLPITPLQDALAEGTETLILTLASGAYARGAPATLYLTDDETATPALGFATAGSVVAESAGTLAVPVTLSAAATVPVSVEYLVTSPGTATNSGLQFSTTLPRWVRIVRAGPVFTCAQSADGSAWSTFSSPPTVVLADPVLVGLVVCSSTTDGTTATATFDNVTLSTGALGSLTARDVGSVATAGSFAVGGGTYTVTGSGSTIGGSADSFHFASFPASGDFTFIARVVTSTGTSTSRFAGVMVREDLRRNSRQVLVAARGTTLTQHYSRTATANTADATGVDYTFTPGVLTFAPGVTTQTIPLTLVDDLLAEPNEHIVLTLRNANGAALSSTLNQHVVVVRDNDVAPLQPSIGFAAGQRGLADEAPVGVSTVAEGVAPTVLVSLSQPAATTVTVNYAVTGGTAVSGADYTLPAGTLTFAPGETTKLVPLAFVDDSVVESAETVVLTLSAASGATLTANTLHTVTITDDDLPVVTLAATAAAASESGDPGQWMFSRTGGTTAALVVAFTVSGTATAGSDYTALPASITIPVGASSAPLALAPLADAANETAESVALTLAASASYTVGTASAVSVTIADTNTPVVSIAATDDAASETGPDAGTFTVSRTGATTAALTVSFTITGTATSGSDYTALGTSLTLPAGAAVATLVVNPVNDALTEGTEYVVVSLATSANYALGAASFASVVIADNDTPPTIVVAQPAAKAVQLAAGVGLHLAALATDDGAPNPLAFTWAKFSGPGAVTFGTPAAAATTATFSANGLYILRISVTDGQFTVFDEVTVQVGGFAPAAWLDVSLGAPTTRGGSGEIGGVFTVVGSGSGFTATTDSGHFVARQVEGATSLVVARVTGFGAGAGAGALAGVMLRETNYRGARRAVLGVKPSGALEWHTRSSVSGANTLTAGGTAVFPVWLKLERNGDTLTAFRAADTAGAPGAWTPVGAALTLAALAPAVDLGLAATNAVLNTTVVAGFDQVTLSPAGTALVDEDLGVPGTAGSTVVNGSSYTLSASGTLGDSGRFRYQQFVGDVTITARLVSHTGSALSAKGGVMVRDASADSAAHGMMGIAHSWGGYFTWRNVIGGSSATSYGSSAVNPQWIRLVRAGDTLTAFRATNAATNTPNAWIKQGSTQVFSAGAAIYVGLAVDSAATALNTVVLDNLSVLPGNLAPVVTPPPGGSFALNTVALEATVTDDGQPNPPGAVTTLWSKVSGPGTVTFGQPNLVDTSALFSGSGTYVLRLTADDGEVRVFADTTYVIAVAAPPTIATAPPSRQIGAGGEVTLSVVAGGVGPFTYQWQKDGVAVPGATAASLVLGAVGVGQAGSYTVVVGNSGGSVTSAAAVLAVVPTGTEAGHQVVTAGYVGSTQLTLAHTLTYAGPAAALDWQTVLPTGWTFVSETGSAAQVKPAVGAANLLTWSWTTIPTSPLAFRFVVAVPAGQSGAQAVASLVNLRLSGPALQLLAQPDPLVVVVGAARHSADTDANGRLSLVELTRVIELYNARNGTVRTGAYTLDAATEDGFAPDLVRSGPAALTPYHIADTNRDALIGLIELTRIIELYNARSGAARTGAYHPDAGTEDGFASGP